MDKLTAAITAAYQRQTMLIQNQNDLITIVNKALMGQIPDDLGWYLTDAIQSYYRRDLEDINTIINALEGVRDAK